jgi:hypothetical protein
VIQGSALGVGSHTVTVTYAIWNGVAYAPYSVDIPDRSDAPSDLSR